MNIKRRAAVTGLFGWMALLAFSPLLDWKKPGSGFHSEWMIPSTA